MREATLIEGVELEDLPEPACADRMLTDGWESARDQILPQRGAFRRGRLHPIRESKSRSVIPDATGLPTNLVAFAEATRDSFREALVYAIVLIGAASSILLWRRPAPVMLVVAPLDRSAIRAHDRRHGDLMGIDVQFREHRRDPAAPGHRRRQWHPPRAPSGNPPRDPESSANTLLVEYDGTAPSSTARSRRPMSFGTLALSSHRGDSRAWASVLSDRNGADGDQRISSYYRPS